MVGDPSLRGPQLLSTAPPDWPRDEERPPDLDLGDDHFLCWLKWDPDLDLNPQYERFRSLLPVERCGALVYHRQPRSETGWCLGGINFDLPPMREVFPQSHVWQVQSFDPLTLSPSLLCRARLPDGECGDHGFIREGRWVRA